MRRSSRSPAGTDANARRTDPAFLDASVGGSVGRSVEAAENLDARDFGGAAFFLSAGRAEAADASPRRAAGRRSLRRHVTCGYNFRTPEAPAIRRPDYCAAIDEGRAARRNSPNDGEPK
jgi:hypothetical protein